MMTMTQMLLKKPDISCFMNSLRASSTVSLVTSLAEPMVTPSRDMVISPSVMPEAMGAVSASPLSSL